MQDQIVFDGTNVFAFMVHNPILTGHILVCPKQPVAKYKDLDAEQLFELSLTVQLITRVAEKIQTDRQEEEQKRLITSSSAQKEQQLPKIDEGSATISIQEGVATG